MLRLGPLVLLPLLTLACGGNVVASNSSGTTSGSGGSGTSGVTASSSASSSSASTTGAGGQGGSAGSGGSAACGTMELTEDNGPPRHLPANCAGDTTDASYTTAIGYYVGNPIQHAEYLDVVGCVSDAAGAEGITLSASGASGPGTYTMGTTAFTDAQGKSWGTMTDPFEMVVTASGTSIDGTFSVTVTDAASASHKLVGQFHVCHGSDFLPP